ncbi:TonB-dependent receptor [Aquimarina sp. U1-2]|uniref:TonB-dependent receptor n=1 Tax=Aquimarina sp. U1-2 TaxID=2823141 RepID=UPI001AECA50C|nr:carboxypeptidase regulatory-like domain-containing protein [Aquimarina sp. U1-2]MBP2832087.1 TonB-dependent receptor [Aquimarina sp. U1-2]
MKKLILLLFIISIGYGSHAQITTANISGIVYDSTNQLLPGANVSAVHTPTGTTYGGVTDFDGRFNLNNLRVGGPYRITISYVGFKKQLIDDIFLQLGETFNLDVILVEDDNQLEEVIITSNKNSTFSSERTGAETNVGRRELTTLPTISRSAQDFTRLEPTASGNSFGGRNDQFNNFSLDGAVFNNPFGLDAATPGGQTDAQPISLDAIEQIQVLTAPYDVTLAGFTGASINAVTKSGTNNFSGTAYGFFRNEDLTGGKIKGDDVFKSDLEQTQYGFSFGGPIIKNKVFFFVNAERDQRTDLGTPWLPNTGSGAINESRVLESDMIAVSNALANLGYETGPYQGFTLDAASTKGIFKLDWNINDKHRAAIIYNFLRASKEKPANPTAITPRGPSAATLQFRNSGYEINNNINSFQLEINSNFSSKFANKFQAGYTHFDDFRNPFSSPAPVITIQDEASGSNYIIAGHEPFSINNKLDQKVIQATNNLNVFLGNHTLTAGVSFEMFSFKNSFNLAAYDNFGAAAYRGTFLGGEYPSVADFLADAANPNGVLATNLAFAQDVFATRNALGDGVDGGWRLAELKVGQLAFYLQDEWNINKRLKISYGLRVDKPLYFNTDELIQDYIDTDNGATRNLETVYFNPDTDEEVTLDSTILPTDRVLLSPRLGFNYDVFDNKTLQIRGGTGIFTGRLPFVWLGNQVSGADDAFFQLVDPDFQFPQVFRSSLGIDYKLPNGIILTGDFAYTNDINAVHVQNWGIRRPTETLQGVDNRPIYGANDRGENNAYVLTNSNQGRVINASFKAAKRFSNNLYASIAYSYLDAKDVNSIEAEITGDAFNGNPALGNVNNDVLANSKYGDNHRIIAVASKKWTYGNEKYATTISGFAEFAQGGRFNYIYAGDINNDGALPFPGAGGSNVNDLIYIPTASEIELMNFSEAGQAEAFEAYIQQDDYLRENRGRYAERYGAIAPWRSRVDVKVLQDFNFNINDKTNTIQLSIDVLNIGNLINSDWGLVQQPNNAQVLGVSVDPNTNVPTYTFDEGVTETFGVDASLQSRWQMQFGLRYIFN